MMDNFRQGYREEAREHLVELESALLELDQNRGDVSIVGRAFRALHTIKGSGAMFGFEEIAAFTHDIENAFDQLRTGRLQATADLINLTLAAGDQIKTMLDESEGVGAVDKNRSSEILKQFRLLTGAASVAPTSISVAPSQAGPSPGNTAERCQWHIFFKPGVDILLNGTDPLCLLEGLREMGELNVSLNADQLPPLADINPQGCYLSWDLTLTTSVSQEAIRELFMFVEDDCELLIEPLKIQETDAYRAARRAFSRLPPRVRPMPTAPITIPVSASLTKNSTNSST